MHKRNLYGVSLVEVLVAVVILSLGIISAAQCMNAAFITNKKAQNMAVSTAIAAGRIEEIRQDGFVNTLNSIPMTSGVGVLDGTANLLPEQKNNGRTLTTTIRYYNDSVNLNPNSIIQVVVKVAWIGAKGKVNDVTLNTLMSDRDRL